MTDDTRRILVDTNVWLDNYLPMRPHSQESRAFLSAALSQGVRPLYAVHALKDVFYLIKATLKREVRAKSGSVTDDDATAIAQAAWGCVANMRELATAVGADESDAWLAVKYQRLSNDLEDGFMLAAAERAQATWLVTWDDELIRKATVPAFTPVDAHTLLIS